MLRPTSKPPEMKICFLFAFIGLAIGFALPTFAQQKDTPDPQLREKLVAAIKKHTDALDKNDAAAVAANFTEDAVSVEQDGPTFGREAIEKWYADLFQKLHIQLGHSMSVPQYAIFLELSLLVVAHKRADLRNLIGSACRGSGGLSPCDSPNNIGYPGIWCPGID